MKYAHCLLLASSAYSIQTTAQGQITYIDQDRRIQAGTQNPNCAQAATAPDFGPFAQLVECGTSHASQNSTLGASTIISQTDTGASCGGPPCTGNAFSYFTVHFSLTQDIHYTLKGQVAGPGVQAEVELIGPSGTVHEVAGNTPFNYCGTLPSGTYEIYAQAYGTAGSFSSNNLNLRIVKNGDVDADGSVGINDLVGVITSWGRCATPQNCPQDFTCDGSVGINDLVAVVTNWG